MNISLDLRFFITAHTNKHTHLEFCEKVVLSVITHILIYTHIALFSIQHAHTRGKILHFPTKNSTITPVCRDKTVSQKKSPYTRKASLYTIKRKIDIKIYINACMHFCVCVRSTRTYAYFLYNTSFQQNPMCTLFY